MTDRFALLTKDSLRSLEYARNITKDFGQTIITPNHMLLGILALEGCQGERVLQQFSIHIDLMATRLSAYIKLAADEGEDSVRLGAEERGFRLSDESVAILDSAAYVAYEQGIDFVDTRVLILGMLRDRRNSAGEILRQFDITSDSYSQRAKLDDVPPADVSSQQRIPRQVSGNLSLGISPIFLILAAFFAVSGYLTYAKIGDTGLTMFLFVILGWVISVALHEFGHAVAAYRGGDESMVEKGYLSLDPLKYTHPLLSIGMPILFLIIGALPLPGGAVYINPLAIRGRKMLSLVSAAGPIATGLVGVILMTPFVLGLYESGLSEHTEFWAGVALLLLLQVFALFLNLLPLPGLDGFGILEPWLPPSLLRIAQVIRPFAFILLFFAFIYTPFGQEMGLAVMDLLGSINEDIPWLAGMGFDLFFFWQ